MKIQALIAFCMLLNLTGCSQSGESGQPADVPVPDAPVAVQPSPVPAPKATVIAPAPADRGATPGRLESMHDVACIPLSEAKNIYTPADLFKGSVQCFQADKPKAGVELFYLARIYGSYDEMRLRDKSTNQAVVALQLQDFAVLSADEKQTVASQLKAYAADANQWSEFCDTIRAIGLPDYRPTYMIQFGLHASDVVNRAGDQPVANFDPAVTWEQVLTQTHHCPPQSG